FLGRGAPKDAAQAAHWYEKAAAQGDEGACYIVASMYEQGDGVARDLPLAYYWYAQAAAHGDRSAEIKAREVLARIRRAGVE
ncbi:MAG: sel1 repeat family protein, partial [Burkholderiaceae bacterium]|nr:sel1 repeat family protein [Burkholderiaceae bacterium]